MTNAKEYARVNYQNYPGTTPQEKMQNAYRSKFSQLLSKERAVTSTVELIRQKENEIVRSEAVRVNPRKAAETAVKINEGIIKVPGVTTSIASFGSISEKLFTDMIALFSIFSSYFIEIIYFSNSLSLIGSTSI